LGGGDNPYTTGNLGKGWNELDLVPFRFILINSGTQTTYNVTIAADEIDAGTLGYDVITEPEVIPPGNLNGFSDPGCAVISTSQAEGPGITGGADTSTYRELTITHPAGVTCVIDWAQRLSIESSDYAGSNLQAYKFESDDFKTGKATIPLPVNQILEQELNKDMTASQDTDFAWNLTKTANPATVSLGNTCDPNNLKQKPVTIRVGWEILPGAPGMVMVVTNIYATNPAARSLKVGVIDIIFGDLGMGEVAIDQDSPDDLVEVPANTAQFLVFKHIFEAPANVTDLRNEATASYFDDVTGIDKLVGQTFAEAPATIQPGTQTNTNANITDIEQISGDGLWYSVNNTTVGSANGSFIIFDGNNTSYNLSEWLSQDYPELLWALVEQNGSLDCTNPEGCPVGFVEFNKEVAYMGDPAIINGTLSDTSS
jgi:hypothetical protein